MRVALALAFFAAACGSGSTNSAVPQGSEEGSINVSIIGSGRVVSTPASIDCGTSCTGTFAAGTPVQLIATPAAGWSFQAWTGACSGNGVCNLETTNANASVVATFTVIAPPPIKQFHLDVIVQGSGAGSVASIPTGAACSTSCATIFAAGTSITLSATAARGSTFTGFSGACSGSGPCTITLSQDANVYATFEEEAETDAGIVNDGGTVALDGGTADPCQGVATGLPAMQQHRATYGTSSPGYCGIPAADAAGAIALYVSDSQDSRWQLLGAAGNEVGTAAAYSGQLFAQASGYLIAQGQTGGSSPIYERIQEDGGFIGDSPQLFGNPISIAGPSGLVLAIGPFSTPAPNPRPESAALLGQDGQLAWGPQALALQATIFGGGLDLENRALVIQDGTSVFGAGSIAAQWFENDGTQMGAPFLLIANFQPGSSTWFETSPLIGGGLAIRRMDAVEDAIGNADPELITSQWMVVVASGSSNPFAAPAWLQSRPDTNLIVVPSGRGYATAPLRADVAPCSQQVELLSPAGASCASFSLSIDSGSCRTRDLGVGLDGTLLQMLPYDREQQLTVGSRTCTLRFWPAALRNAWR